MVSNFRSKGFIFVISSPSGCGKTTLVKLLLKNDRNLKQSISVTTRPKRKGEMDGKDYFFITESKYRDMVKKDLLLEHAQVFKHFYGIPREHVEELLELSTDVACVIDWQGGINLMKKAKQNTVSAFVLPPSLAALKTRLVTRATDSVDIINRRLAEAKKEISKCKYYDYIVINDKFDKCAAQLQSILDVERLKRVRQDTVRLISAVEKK